MLGAQKYRRTQKRKVNGKIRFNMTKMYIWCVWKVTGKESKTIYFNSKQKPRYCTLQSNPHRDKCTLTFFLATRLCTAGRILLVYSSAQSLWVSCLQSGLPLWSPWALREKLHGTRSVNKQMFLNNNVHLSVVIFHIFPNVRWSSSRH